MVGVRMGSMFAFIRTFAFPSSFTNTRFTDDHRLFNAYREGGAMSSPLSKRQSSSLLLTGRDNAGEIRHYQDKLKGLNEQYRETARELEAKKGEYRQVGMRYDGKKVRFFAVVSELRVLMRLSVERRRSGGPRRQSGQSEADDASTRGE